MSSFKPFIYNNSILFFNNQVLSWEVSTGGTGTGYVSQYQTVYNSFTTKPSSDVATAQNTMVSSLVSGGVWAKLDLFYCFANDTSANALVNWVTPGSYTCSLVNNPSFNTLEGFTGDGATRYIDTTFNASTNGVHYTRLNAAISVYTRLNQPEGYYFVLGASDSYSHTYISPYQFSALYGTLNTVAGGVSSATVSNSQGLSTITRNSGNLYAYRNDVSLSNSTIYWDNSAPSANFEVLRQGNGFWSSNEVSFVAIGGILTTNDVSTLYHSIQTYMTSNGKQV